MKKLILTGLFLLTTPSSFYANESSKINTIDQVCAELTSDIIIVHNNLSDADDMDTSDLTEEESKEWMDLYMILLEVQLANTQMYSDLECKEGNI